MAKRKIFSLNRELQEGLTQTMTAAKHYAGELRFEIIPLSQIEFDPENPRNLCLEFSDLPQGPQQQDENYERKMVEIVRLNSLAEAINTQGLINPVLVYKYENMYRLVAGERRCLASKMAGKVDIKANILNERPSEYRQRLLQWIENVEREDLSLWERLMNIKMILNAYQKQTLTTEAISANLIKNLLGCSAPQANNYFIVLTASEMVLEAIEQNQLKNLEKAALIAKTTGAMQKQLLHNCVAGSSLKQLKQLAEQNALAEKQQRKKILATQLASGRGRKTNRVDLGAVREPWIVKILVDSVIAQDRYRHYHSRFSNVDWDNAMGAALASKELLSIIQLVEIQ